MIVADTGAVVALVDADDRHHDRIRVLFEADPDRWILPWAVLPEVDYLLLRHVGHAAELAFVEDVAEGRWHVDWGSPADLRRAHALCAGHRDLRLGLVDGLVMATAERLRATGIATLDHRHFDAVRLHRPLSLLPRDA
jgi:uncharacterized protein